MRLNTAAYPPELTLRELHLAAGDFVLASRFGDVTVKLIADAWLVLWRDDKGVAQQLVRTTDAEAFRAAAFLAAHGTLPVSARSSRVKTLSGLTAVGG